MPIILEYYSSSYGLRLNPSLGGTFIAMIAVMILGLVAQAKVRSTYERYSRIPASCGRTASSVANDLLRSFGSNVSVQQINGTLTDNYNPKAGCVSLSRSVFSSTSIAAIAVAAHECGHVQQYQTGYKLIKLRNTILPAASLGAKVSYLLVLLGLFMGTMGYTVSRIGVVLFGFVLAFQLLTLPVELDASKRALNMLTAGGYITGAEEEGGAKKVLNAAAFTYVVAVLSAAVSFLRLLAISNTTRRR